MINASMVKNLREMSGAGMMDCKKALEATNGNMDDAINWLREKGISKAMKKSSRIAAEGLTYGVIDGNKAIVVEVNSETDFVAKNEEFISLVKLVATTIIKNNVNNIDDALKLTVDGKTLEEVIATKSGVIGEKISLRRFELVTKNDEDVFATYSHMGGKIVSLVVMSGNDKDLAYDIAMQVAAMNPKYLDRTLVPDTVIEKEKEVLIEQANNEGMDSNKIPMVVNGRLNKFYEEVCLVDQKFIKENKMSVKKYVESKNSKVISFVRYEVGEGIEKKSENFADEVMKQVNNN